MGMETLVGVLTVLSVAILLGSELLAGMVSGL